MPPATRIDAPPFPDTAVALRPGWRYHFAGIGGVGMSALAEWLHRRGFRVSGSDQHDSPTLRRLAALGLPVRAGHDPAELDGADALVYSSAIREHHPLRRAASARGLPLIHRAALLAALSAGSRLLAVTGTHGKSTTTGALAQVWRACGLRPTGLVGGDVLDWERRNFLYGDPQWIVAEADESDGSFLLLQPESILLTNVEADHLDHHGSLEGLRRAFAEFLRRLPPSGVLVYGMDDPVAAKLARESGARTVSFGLHPDADIAVQVRSMQPGAMALALRAARGSVEITSVLGGRHNAVNLAGAFAMARAHGLPDEQVIPALGSYRGVARRQEFLGRRHGWSLFDDYAHHPTEIRATLEMFRALYDLPMTVLFQPHLFSRTALFAAEIAEALRPAARIFVTEIYAAREEPLPGVSGRNIVDSLRDHPSAKFVEDWRTLAGLLDGDRGPGILLTLGAGDITDLGPLLLRGQRP